MKKKITQQFGNYHLHRQEYGLRAELIVIGFIGCAGDKVKENLVVEKLTSQVKENPMVEKLTTQVRETTENAQAACKCCPQYSISDVMEIHA